jgi:type VI secretion system protein ImpG
LELLPDIEAMQAPLVVEAGSEFASTPVEGTRCRYRSSWPVVLRPWAIDTVRLETEAAKPVRLVVRIRTSEKVSLDTLELDSLRFHLAGDQQTTFTLYLLLAAHLEAVTVSDGSSESNPSVFTLAPEHVSPGGLNRDEGVLPYEPRSFSGYRLLQEYFAFKDRFLFIDVAGLDHAVSHLELTNTIEVAFTFNRRLESFPLVSKDNIRLHCVPIVNLFAHTADPIRMQHDRTQYLIQPTKSGVADRRHAEVYSVDEVGAVTHADGLTPHSYKPFYSFEHLATADPQSATYYQIHVTPNIIGGDARQGTDTWISFVKGSGVGGPAVEETASLELTCTNRNLPSVLRAGDICEPTDSSPAGIRFRNLLSPTETIPPPLGKALPWRLISHMTLHYVSLSDVQHFRELLRVYDFQSEHDAQRGLAQQRLLDGILSIQTRFDERMIRGAAVRGSAIEIVLDEDHFAGEGDAYLFSAILDRFMGLYATINGHTQLTVRFTRSGHVHTFPPRWGEQLTPSGIKEIA